MKKQRKLLVVGIFLFFAGIVGSAAAYAHCCRGAIQCRAAPVGERIKSFVTYCADCSRRPNLSSRCCAEGQKRKSCNLFCCDCKYSCISVSPERFPNCGPSQNVCTPGSNLQASVSDSEDRWKADLMYFDDVDSNQDGRISGEEAALFLTDGALPTDDERRLIKVGFSEMDKDANGFVDIAEFDKDLAAYQMSKSNEGKQGNEE